MTASGCGGIGTHIGNEGHGEVTIIGTRLEIPIQHNEIKVKGGGGGEI